MTKGIMGLLFGVAAIVLLISLLFGDHVKDWNDLIKAIVILFIAVAVAVAGITILGGL